MIKTTFIMLVASLGLAACGDTVGERAATGALGGAVVGEAVGGSPLTGAIIGGAGGALTKLR